MKDTTGAEEAERLLWLHDKYGHLSISEILELLERQTAYSKFLSDTLAKERSEGALHGS